ncbi:YegP family protein [Microbacterium sp. B2969]|uniref:YegP family protein n=1 Tax=Microbacterium alkaliflavum TaxID=3248839 RepID=A0ABW7Q3M2_9MICO
MIDPADTTPSPRKPMREGPRHLRVGLIVRPRSLLVQSVALAPGRPARNVAAGLPWLAAVTRGDDVSYVTRLPDPFTRRSVRLDVTGPHHVDESDEGYAVVALPFDTLTDLLRSQISLVQLGDVGALDPEGLAKVYRERSARGDFARSVGYAEIAATRHWAQIGPMLGIDVPPGRFEIYRDRAELWRWRLRAAGGAIVAASSDSFGSRADAEAEVTWLRRHTADSPSTLADE